MQESPLLQNEIHGFDQSDSTDWTQSSTQSSNVPFSHNHAIEWEYDEWGYSIGSGIALGVSSPNDWSDFHSHSIINGVVQESNGHTHDI